MALTLVYLIFRQLLALLALAIRSDTAKTAEILLLRHENAMLRRQVKRPLRVPIMPSALVTANSIIIARSLSWSAFRRASDR